MADTQDPRNGPVEELSQEQRQRMQYKKALRRKRRKEREGEGEISELNITPMLDMMTIILVFLLKSYSAQSVAMAAAGDVAPPVSSTRLAPKDTVAITITRCKPAPDRVCRPGQGALIVMDKTIFSYDEDKIPAKFKQGGDDGLLILPLQEALAKEVDKIKYIARYNPAVQFTGELSVVGDKDMPYRMLTEILYTAGQVELNNYRFVVIKQEGGGGAEATASAG